VRILFLSHYFPPEVNAPATRTFEHCVQWASAGHDVTVVTCAPNCPAGVLYDGYRNSIRRQVEEVNGVRVVRVWTYLSANARTVGRIANYVSYMLSATLASLRLPRPDVVIATSPQFFCGWAGALVSAWKRAPFVLEIRDIWPDSIEAVSALSNRSLIRFLAWLERRLYRSARHVVTVGGGYRDNIVAKVDLGDRISVISNGVDLDFFRPRQPDPDLLRRWDLEGKFVCSYVGTIGMAHGLEVVPRAAAILKRRGRDDVAFCLVGDGARRRSVEELARRLKVRKQVIFAGRQPKKAIPAVLASSHACLIHLRACELFGTVIPSKIFETMAMARPILLGVPGQAWKLVEAAGAGLAVEPESPESLASAVERLADNPKLAGQLSRSARSYVAEHYDRGRLGRQFLQLLEGVAAGLPPASIVPATQPREAATQPERRFREAA